MTLRAPTVGMFVINLFIKLEDSTRSTNTKDEPKCKTVDLGWL